MRVLLVNQYYSPDVSASAQRLTDLSEDLAADHDVTVLAGRPSYDPVPTMSDGPRTAKGGSRVTVYRVPSTAFRRHRLGLRVLNYLTYLVSVAVWGVFVRLTDVVVVATDPPLAGLVGWWLSRIHRVPMVYLVWDLHPEAAVALGMLTRPWIVSFAARCSRFLLRRASRIVVPSESMRLRVIEAGGRAERVEVISHWEDSAVIYPELKDNPFSREQGLVDRFVIMHSGNIGMGQNLQLCVALADRIRDLSDAVVVLVGEGATKARLQRQVEALRLTNVRFLPYEPRERMRYSLATGDVFIVSLAPRVDGCMVASKAFTAMASARPLVAAVEGSSDVAAVIEQYGCGVRVEPGDIAMLEKTVRWFHQHRAEGAAMGARGRLAVERWYERSVMTPRYRRLLESAVGEGTGPARRPMWTGGVDDATRGRP